jgi:hypothetical protein
MGPGGFRSLQNCCGAGSLVPGGFDSHALPPRNLGTKRRLDDQNWSVQPPFCLLEVRQSGGLDSNGDSNVRECPNSLTPIVRV